MRLLVFPFMIGLCGVLFSIFAHPHHAMSGRIEAQVGAHTVVVTGCRPTRVPLIEQMEATAQGEAAYRFAPCRDAVIVIEGDQLSVNGMPYGTLETDDSIVLHRNSVFVDGVPRVEQSR